MNKSSETLQEQLNKKNLLNPFIYLNYFIYLFEIASHI